MIILLKLIFLTSITVLAWKIVTSEEMLLESVGDWAEKKVDEGNKYFDLLVCQWCMPSVWSLAGFFFAWVTGIVTFDKWTMVFYYPLCVFGSSILCGLTWIMYLTINQIKDKNEAEYKYYIKAEELTHFDIKDRKKEYIEKNKK